MTQHTPGPWRIWPCGNCDIDSANGNLEIASTHQDLLTGGFRDPNTAQADARLIAATPELLFACQEFLERFDGGSRADTDYIARLMREAVAKAVQS